MTTPFKPGRLQNLWYAYKSLNLPWRKKFFRGFDLDGNAFYESHNPLTPNKLRRTVVYRRDGHYTDNNVTPQWMSWLRHTRPHAPTLAELEGEVERIHRTRDNARLIRDRWDAERNRLALAAGAGAADPTESADEAVARQEARRETQAQAREQAESVQHRDDDDHLQAPGTRDEKGEWQPESWRPASKPIKR